MSQIEAFCNNCNVFFGSGVNISGSSIVTMQNNTVNCPKCGKITSMPDGVFKFVRGSIELINNSDISLRRLHAIRENLIELNRSKTNLDKAKNEITNDIPELRGLVSALPKTRTELYAFLALLVMIVGMAITNFSGNKKQPIEYNKFITNNHYNTTDTIIKRDTVRIQPKIQRNEKCPCGSGKKYKFCCGGN
ncbi:SEC-C metal-binding domain-containing protein [Labilibaculum euxinus]